jgi:endonuclease-3
VPLPRGAKQRAPIVIDRLLIEYPDAECALVHANPFELLVATILSAQSTDETVNKVTPALYARYPTPADLAAASPDELEALIHSTGFFHAKAKSLLGMARAVEERFDGEVPTALEDLVTLPGVGRKTANVVMNVAFGEPTMAVDTHVFRVANRIGLVRSKNPLDTETQLLRVVPPAYGVHAHHWLILHGRYLCKARKPECWRCLIADLCRFTPKTPAPA